MDAAVKAAIGIVAASAAWCERYEGVVEASLERPADFTEGRSDRELLELAMGTDYITAADMYDVVTGEQTIRDVVRGYALATRLRAMSVLRAVRRALAEEPDLERLARAADAPLRTAFVTVADIVLHLAPREMCAGTE